MEPRPPRLPFRPYVGLVTGLLSVAGISMPLSAALGFSARTSPVSYAAAVAVGGVGVLAWAGVVFGRGPGGRPGGIAWVSFPVAFLAPAAMIPLLVGAVVPDAIEALLSPHRLRVSREGVGIVIEFPRRVKDDTINLQLNDTAVPEGYFRANPARARWRHVGEPRPRSFLYLDLDLIGADLGVGRVQSLGLNRVRGTAQMEDAAGERFPPQRVEVPG
ncbi:MAG: hypothetical protein ACRD2T_12315 [Thermoanaerobaculia bacterium]